MKCYCLTFGTPFWKFFFGVVLPLVLNFGSLRESLCTQVSLKKVETKNNIVDKTHT